MHTLAKERALHLHGEPYARLNRNESLIEDLSKRQYERSHLFLLLLLFFFYLPDKYLRELEQVWLDGQVNCVPWNRFILLLKQDWDKLALLATVLLSANVGLLAVPNVVNSDSEVNAAQIASYCSLLLSTTGIVMCFILSLKHRSHGLDEDMESPLNWLKTTADTPWKMEKLAIILSLPSVLFTWGTICFCISGLWVFFHDATVVEICVLGTMLVVNVGLVIWVVFMGWEPTDPAACLSRRLRDAFRARWESHFVSIDRTFLRPQLTWMFPTLPSLPWSWQTREGEEGRRSNVLSV